MEAFRFFILKRFWKHGTLMFQSAIDPAANAHELRFFLFEREKRFCLEPVLREAWPQVYPEAAICVQRFDDSLNSAIRITYRISLRSSSLREPRYPLLTVVLLFRSYLPQSAQSSTFESTFEI